MIEWHDSLTPQLERILALAEDMSEDVAAGADVILVEAVKRVPKESGDLAASGRVDKERGGLNTVAVTFDGPYARWIHEHLFFKHPHGGEPKFLERGMGDKGDAAVNRAGEHFWGRI